MGQGSWVELKMKVSPRGIRPMTRNWCVFMARPFGIMFLVRQKEGGCLECTASLESDALEEMITTICWSKKYFIFDQMNCTLYGLIGTSNMISVISVYPSLSYSVHAFSAWACFILNFRFLKQKQHCHVTFETGGLLAHLDFPQIFQVGSFLSARCNWCLLCDMSSNKNLGEFTWGGDANFCICEWTRRLNSF